MIIRKTARRWFQVGLIAVSYAAPQLGAQPRSPPTPQNEPTASDRQKDVGSSASPPSPDPLSQPCPSEAKPQALAPEAVYEGMPFQPGEKATYEMRYFGALAGYGDIEVQAPELIGGTWHRKFTADAKTGDWYRYIFVAHDSMEAVSRPQDFAVSRFYLEQHEGKLIGRAFHQKKWLEFSHGNCLVHERVVQPKKDEELTDNRLEPGAMDALGVVFNLRTRTFKLNRAETALVYTSGQNWILEAMPVAFEKVSTPAGTFDAVKLKLVTYLGKDLQQRGELYAWIDVVAKERPLVKIQGDVKIGSVTIALTRFQGGGAPAAAATTPVQNAAPALPVGGSIQQPQGTGETIKAPPP